MVGLRLDERTAQIEPGGVQWISTWWIPEFSLLPWTTSCYRKMNWLKFWESTNIRYYFYDFYSNVRIKFQSVFYFSKIQHIVYITSQQEIYIDENDKGRKQHPIGHKIVRTQK